MRGLRGREAGVTTAGTQVALLMAMKKQVQADGKFMSDGESARILGVELETVRAWVEKGRLRGRRWQGKPGRTRYMVERASIKGAFMCTCQLCGKRFKTLKKPLKAKYCCAKHRRAAHHIRNRTSLKPYRMREMPG